MQITAGVTSDLAFLQPLCGRSSGCVSIVSLRQASVGLRAPEVAQIWTSRLLGEEVGGKDLELGLTAVWCLQAPCEVWRWSTRTCRRPR